MRAIRQETPRRQARRVAPQVISRLLANLPRLEASDLGRPKSRVRNPIMAGYLEGITQALYDIYAVALNTTTIKLVMFAVPQGQSYALGGVTTFVKTAGHTSMIQAGVLEAPKKHIVRAISFSWEANTVGNDAEKLSKTFLQFNVNGKSYQDTLIERVPGGGGPSASMMGTFAATNGFSLTSNGWPVTNNTYVLAYGGVPIEQQQNFNVIVDPTISNVTASAFTTANTVSAPGTPIAGVGIYAHVYLDGILFRAVQ